MEASRTGIICGTQEHKKKQNVAHCPCASAQFLRAQCETLSKRYAAGRTEVEAFVEQGNPVGTVSGFRVATRVRSRASGVAAVPNSARTGPVFVDTSRPSVARAVARRSAAPMPRGATRDHTSSRPQYRRVCAYCFRGSADVFVDAGFVN